MTGELFSDASIVSPGQIMAPGNMNWNKDIINLLGIDTSLFPKMHECGAYKGKLLHSVLGDGSEVDVSFAIHDTASAVEAIPSKSEMFAFISVVTWSLMGIKTDKPIVNDYTYENLFSNIYTFNNKFLILKNIMGTWMLESCKKQWEAKGETYNWDELISLAERAKDFEAYIDVNDEMFFSGIDIPEKVSEYCEKRNQTAPQTKSETIRVIVESMAMKFKETFDKLEKLHGEKLDMLHIVGALKTECFVNVRRI